MDETYEQDQTYQRTPLRRPVRPVPQEDEKRKMRIKIWMGWALIIAALCADLAELFGGYLSAEIAAFVVGIIASFVFWVWFLILGVPYSSNTKRFITTIIVGLGEIIPGPDAIPFWFLWTAGMIIIVGMVRMEDKGEKPTILGGIMEGLGMVLSTNVFAPVAIPVGMALVTLNKVRRLIKRKAFLGKGIGQADWVKRNMEIRKTNKEMTREAINHPDRIQQIQEKYRRVAEQRKNRVGNGVLNLKNITKNIIGKTTGNSASSATNGVTDKLKKAA